MDFVPYLFEFVDDMLDEAQRRGGYRRKFHKRYDPFELSDEQFVEIFRLTKPIVDDLITLVADRTPPVGRLSALDPTVKVLTALRFMASGGYQNDIGHNIYMAVSQSSVSRCIHAVIDILNQPDVCNEWVHFPRNLGEMEEVRWRFYEKFRFPGVIGCVDCTHVAIAPPKHDVEYLYVNRKGYHSLNVQLICDADYRILNANARYPGRSHDSFIWNNCDVLPLMRRLHATGNDDFFLLGDSGYGLRPWLMTPILNAAPGSPEDRYNRRVTHTRSLIERVNAVLKMRFRCLLKHRFLHYDPVVAAKITNACIVLHNICVSNNLVPPMMPREDREKIDFGIHRQFPQDEAAPVIRRVNPELASGRTRQRRLIEAFFT